MAKTTKLSLIDGKIDELKAAIAGLTNANVTDKDAEGYMSPNTRSTQLNAKRRERRTLQLIRTLIEMVGDDVVLPSEDQEQLVRITTLASEHTVTKYVFQEGDNIFELMQKYDKLSRKDMEDKAAKFGLKLDFTTGKVVKA